MQTGIALGGTVEITQIAKKGDVVDDYYWGTAKVADPYRRRLSSRELSDSPECNVACC